MIAIDPDAPLPGRARWFDLDRFAGAPRLATWVARTDDLDAVVARHPEIGRPMTLTRGPYRWRMAVREDGAMPFDGAFPAIVEWDGDAPRLPDTGLRMRSLRIVHPDAATLAPTLAALVPDPRITVAPGDLRLEAEIDTPGGRRTLA